MAARFQRLANSEDISMAPGYNYSSQMYEEPQQTSPDMQSQGVYSPTGSRNMSYSSRKPVPYTAYSNTPTPEQPLITNYFDNPSRISQSSGQMPDQKRKSSSSVFSKAINLVSSRARGQHVSNASTPLFAAPWRHAPCADLGGARSSTVRFFDHRKQRRRIFFHFFLQWLVPVFFCAALTLVLYRYNAKEQISRNQKYWFNTLVVGLSLCLGFAVVDGMKSYASIFRWRLLSSQYHSLQQFELILGLASQKKAARLLWVGRTEGSFKPNGTQILCFCYLTIIMGLQIVIALLGLCFSVDVAPFPTIMLVNGNVSVVNLTKIEQYENFKVNVDEFQLQSGAANAYGVSGQRYPVWEVVSDTEVKEIEAGTGFPIYTDNSTLWWYRFIDQCPEEGCQTEYDSGRWVSAQANCTAHTIISGGYVNDDNVTYINSDGDTAWITYALSETAATTTWYGDTAKTCGDRCTTVYALNMGWIGNTAAEQWAPQFFECTNTLSEVKNVTGRPTPEVYELPDEQARVLAGAIGFNGAAYNSTLQARTYDIGSLWSWTRFDGADLSESDMANLLMRFSIGAVASIDFSGPRQFVFGPSPKVAQNVSVEWVWAIAVLVVVPGVQFLVLLATVFWGNTAVVRDDSFLSAANLLRPIVERLERRGCALTSDEICEVLGNPNIAYGVRVPQTRGYGGMMKGQEDVMHLDIIDEEDDLRSATGAWRIGTRMPQGRYDGPPDEKATLIRKR